MTPSSSRRKFLKDISSISALVAMNLISNKTYAMAKNATIAKKPNILFITTDQQSASMMSSANNKWLKTPNMDALAKNGCTFTNAFSCNPVCLPARSGFMLGAHPGKFGIVNNDDGIKIALAQELEKNCLGNFLNANGYDSAISGKTHWMKNMEQKGGLKQIATVYGRENEVEKSIEFFNKKRKEDEPFFLWTSLINPHDICFMGLTDALREEPKPHYNDKPALAELKKAMAIPENVTEEEFFSTICPDLPKNHELPQGWDDNLSPTRDFRAKIMKGWTQKDWRLHRWAYCRLTELVDKQIGKLIQGLKDSGQYENTLIIFTSDHGDMDASHKMEHKSVFFEESIHIPYIISNPAFAKKDTKCDKLVSNVIDTFVTICDYANIKEPDNMEGLSLKNLAQGKKENSWRTCVFAEGDNESDLRSLMTRTEDGKYCIYKKNGKIYEQYYDLSKNKLEMKNEFENPVFKSQITKHKELLSSWIKDKRTLPL